MAGHVFVSYSHLDAGYVQSLVAHLRRVGLKVWVDEEIDYGNRWQNVIRQHLDACAVFVPVMTPSSEDSPWVAREILRAEAKDKHIVPLLLRGDVFFRLADLQYEDVRRGQPPRREFVDRLRRLTEVGTAPVDVARATPRLGAVTEVGDVVYLQPATYDEARTIGERYRDHNVPVLIDLSKTDEPDAKRLVDFAVGMVYFAGGTIERVVNRMFLLCPANVTVSAQVKAAIAARGPGWRSNEPDVS